MSSLQPTPEFDRLDERTKAYLYAKRQALIIELGAIEDLLNLERSIVPRHKRREPRHEHSDHETRER